MTSTSPLEAVVPRRAGRPRSEEADRAILDAALDALVDDGYGGMSIERIAAKAGVGKATIYRRWNGKAEILVEALRRRACFDVPLVDTGDLRADLLTILQAVYTNMKGVDGPVMAAEPSTASMFARSALPA
jgi:AcrR family transcriptional regulator